MAFNDLKVKDQDFEGKNIQSIRGNMVTGRADELKRLFDAPAQEVLKEKINALIDYLCSTESASEIGAPQLDDRSGNTVAAQLNYIYHEMQDLYAGSIADNSIEDVKLSDKAGQIKARIAGVCKMLEMLDQAPNNSIVRWCNDDEKRFEHILTAIGALYVLNPEVGPEYGVLPVECGGTGADNAADARSILGAVSNAGDTIAGGLNIEAGSSGSGYTVRRTVDSNEYAAGLYVDSTGRAVVVHKTGNTLDCYMGLKSDAVNFSKKITVSGDGNFDGNLNINSLSASQTALYLTSGESDQYKACLYANNTGNIGIFDSANSKAILRYNADTGTITALAGISMSFSNGTLSINWMK